MNRAERRQRLRAGMNPKEVMDKYRNDVYEQGFNDGIDHAGMSILTITAYCLHNHLGLGRQRLPEIMEWIGLNIDSFSTGQLQPDDIKLMKEELEKYNVYFGRTV